MALLSDSVSRRPDSVSLEGATHEVSERLGLEGSRPQGYLGVVGGERESPCIQKLEPCSNVKLLEQLLICCSCRSQRVAFVETEIKPRTAKRSAGGTVQNKNVGLLIEKLRIFKMTEEQNKTK